MAVYGALLRAWDPTTVMRRRAAMQATAATRRQLAAGRSPYAGTGAHPSCAPATCPRCAPPHTLSDRPLSSVRTGRTSWPRCRDGRRSVTSCSARAERRRELFSLLALGPEFQLRLSATVAAAWADGGSRAGERDAARPALVAALAGRLAPAAQAWLGVDPGRVDVSLHEGEGWGRLAVSGTGRERRLSAALPVSWLASVWAAGLAVTAGHLVVAVTAAAWPDATVLAVPEPGADPVILKVRAAEAGAGRRPTGAATRRRGTMSGNGRCTAGAQRHDAAVAALGVAVAARVPVLLWGAPGTGKTSTIRAMAEKMGWPCETVIASIREPSDFAGLPVVVGDGVRFAPPGWARRLAEAGRGLLFLDELSTAPPAVQAALLRVVLERVVGDLALPAGRSRGRGGQPAGAGRRRLGPVGAAGQPAVPPGLGNRPGAVADGLAGGWAAPVVPTLPDRWEAGVGLARGLVAAFLHVRPALACAPPADAASAGRGWPSPRTWDMAARLLAAGDAAGAGEETRSALVRGCVGEGAGVEFLAWLVEMDLPDPEAVLADPGSFVLPKRGDRAYAAVAAVAAVVAADPTPQRWVAGWQVLGRAAAGAPDVAAVAARTLARCRPDGTPPPAEVKLFAPVLRDAGLLGG